VTALAAEVADEGFDAGNGHRDDAEIERLIAVADEVEAESQGFGVQGWES
jgi:hypothetical protein